MAVKRRQIVTNPSIIQTPETLTSVLLIIETSQTAEVTHKEPDRETIDFGKE